MFKLPNSFMAGDVYKAFEDEKNFLFQLEQVFDWQKMAEPLWSLAKNEQGGRPRWSPVVMLKMLFVAFLYDRSDREMEELATYDIRVKQFLHLPIDALAPDHTSLCRFREAVIGTLGTTFFDSLFEQVLTTAKGHGICFGRVYAIDATHVESCVNGKKDSHEVNVYGGESKDPDASWGAKGHETKITPAGNKVRVVKHFFGYKVHGLCETKHGLVTHLSVTTGSKSDLDAGDELIHRQLTDEQRHRIDVLLADKGYACPVWVNLLEKHTDIMTAFSLPDTMTKQGEHQLKWQAYMAEQGRQAWRRLRTVIERIFGDVKDNHGLRRGRYKGEPKLYLQASCSFMAHNVKRLIALITGTRFKTI
jgi:IS5 family transposase